MAMIGFNEQGKPVGPDIDIRGQPILPAKRGAVFTHQEWDRLLADTFEEIRKLAALKGGEYSGDVDRLANFRRNGADCGVPMELVWRIYAGKHWDSVTQYIHDLMTGTSRPRLESIDGRVDDLLTYLLLFKAMLRERAAKVHGQG